MTAEYEAACNRPMRSSESGTTTRTFIPAASFTVRSAEAPGCLRSARMSATETPASMSASNPPNACAPADVANSWRGAAGKLAITATIQAPKSGNAGSGTFRETQISSLASQLPTAPPATMPAAQLNPVTYDPAFPSAMATPTNETHAAAMSPPKAPVARNR